MLEKLRWAIQQLWWSIVDGFDVVRAKIGRKTLTKRSHSKEGHESQSWFGTVESKLTRTRPTTALAVGILVGIVGAGLVAFALWPDTKGGGTDSVVLGVPAAPSAMLTPPTDEQTRNLWCSQSLNELSRLTAGGQKKAGANTLTDVRHYYQVISNVCGESQKSQANTMLNTWTSS